MALIDSVLGLVNKTPKDPDAPKPAPGSRSEREARIKDKAGMVINVFALCLAVNAWYGGKLGSTVLNNTIKANDTYSFYQAKSIKQSLAEQNLYEAQRNGDKDRAVEMAAKIEKYENEPVEGKRDLLAKAKALEAERDEAKQRSPWIGYASTAYQMAIVVLSASILAVSMYLFWASFAVAGFGLLLSLNGLFLWF
jgi:hydroxylamine reductase (hybrid-cluster protein)